MAPSAALAQALPSPCYYTALDTDPLSPTHGEEIPYSYYSECGEAAPAVAAVGSNLAGIGDAMVQQQLNFGGGGVGAFASPTGRLRHSSHDGLRETTTGATTGKFETDEGSVFANGSYDLPGTWFGGNVRVSGLLGYDRLSQDAQLGTFKTEIDSFVYGGSYLWSKGSFYSMSLIIGLSGEADTSNAGGTYSYDLSGYFTNSVMGYTFNNTGSWKFDLRGSLGHYDVSGDSFLMPGTALRIKGESEAWNAAITATFFTLVEHNGGTMRPYFLASYKNVFDEDIEVKGDFTASFEQADDFGKLEIGFDYVSGRVTYGVAGYTEFSEDEHTVGARLGASFKFQ
jgi:hypothetical protein